MIMRSARTAAVRALYAFLCKKAVFLSGKVQEVACCGYLYCKKEKIMIIYNSMQRFMEREG